MNDSFAGWILAVSVCVFLFWDNDKGQDVHDLVQKYLTQQIEQGAK